MSRTIFETTALTYGQWLQMNMTTVPFSPRTDSSVCVCPSMPGSSNGAARNRSSPAGVVRLTMVTSCVLAERVCQNLAKMLALFRGVPRCRSSAIPIPTGSSSAALPIASRGEASASFFTGAAHSLKRTPPRAADRDLPRDLHRRRGLRRSDPARRRTGADRRKRHRGGEGVRRRPRARLAGASGRDGRGGRLRSVCAALARAHRTRASAARSAAPACADGGQRRSGRARRAAHRGERATPSG